MSEYERGRGNGSNDEPRASSSNTFGCEEISPGKRTLTQNLSPRAPVCARPAPIQQKHERGGLGGDPHELAAGGTAGVATPLPYRDEIQAAFGHHDISGVSAHQDDAAAAACDGLGAMAFATGSRVAFRGAPDLHTAAHEAAHVVQQRAGVYLKDGLGDTGDVFENHADGVADAVVAGRSAEALLDQTPGRGGESPAAVQRREAVPAEKRMWLAPFDNPVARRLLNHYMEDTGEAIPLTKQEMELCNAVVDVRRSTEFLAQVDALRQRGGGHEAVSARGTAVALSSGTLGNFTVWWNGSVRVQRDGSWHFNGAMHWADFWDFDPKPFTLNPGPENSNRPIMAEIKTRVAATFLPGSPFAVGSEMVAVSQASTDQFANWPGPPVNWDDNSGIVGADAAADGGSGEVGGAIGGGMIGGPDGAWVGAVGGGDASVDASLHLSEDGNHRPPAGKAKP